MLHTAMNRRTFTSVLGSLVAGWPDVCFGNSWYNPSSWGAWKKIPSIAVISVGNDARLVAVRDAVAFWNAMLSNAGSSFRLGPVIQYADAALYGDLRQYSDRGTFGDLRAHFSWVAFDLRDRLATVNEDIVLLLSDRAGISFATSLPGPRKMFIVICNITGFTFDRKIGVHNVIAHELGHAIGLGHNGEPEALMCGGGGCIFDGPGDEFLPLTRRDGQSLLGMYPPGWQPEASYKSVDVLPIPPLR